MPEVLIDYAGFDALNHFLSLDQSGKIRYIGIIDARSGKYLRKNPQW